VAPRTIAHDSPRSVTPGDYLTTENACLSPEEYTHPPMVIAGQGKEMNDAGNVDVLYTYSVEWRPSATAWASRWDIYLSMDHRYNTEVHWFAIVNSLLIILLLTGMVALIMMRTLRKDVLYYNRVMTDEERAEEKEESGWKLIHGDVFRPPARWPMLFSIAVGTSTQLFGMAVFTLAFAAIGFLSPANRGSLMIALVSLFVLMGTVAGYSAARTYKMFGGKEWQRCILLTAMLFPGWVFSVFFVVNLFVWHTGSSGAVPFGSLFAVLALWMGISVPLTFLGAYFGFRREAIDLPCAVSPYPRQIPPQVWYLQPLVTVAVGGILPFGAVFVELFFILSSLWLDQYYYVFGFLAAVFVILCITCAELTIVMTYFQLCNEDYHWWWRSFLTSGSCAFYLWMYTIFYFYTKLDIVTATSALLYFAYMAIVSVGFFFVTGVIGFTATFWFMVTIYGALKVD
jgi:transmembrane 9 superfamily protein 2/4